ncbi:MAG TPA: alpha/beta hydrolase [Mycobacteriales bacterium]|jgi:pimeloyl-ACP methyl ester carboxylesterase
MLVLFVHGALVRDADWWWHRMPGPLGRHGLRTAAVELPSCVGRGDLAADAAAVAAAVTGAGEPVTLVGHSYGGTVITEAGRDAAHLVYVTSVLADAGRSHADSGSGRGPAPWVRPHPDGTLELVGDRIRELFFADCDDETYEQALARRARQDAAALTGAVTVPAWRSVPSTYVVCTEDRAIPADVQRAAAVRAGRTVEIPTGHHPFLSRPDLFTGTLAGTIRTGVP